MILNRKKTAGMSKSNKFWIGNRTTQMKEKEKHKLTWMSPNGKTSNEMDHVLIKKNTWALEKKESRLSIQFSKRKKSVNQK